MGFSLSAADIGIIVGSIVLVVAVGLLTGRGKHQTARSYFLASGKMPWYIIGSAFVSTSVSSEQIVGTVGAAYKHGMGIANWEWFTVPVYTLAIVFFIPVYLRNRIATVPELLNKRFGPLCGDIYSWIILVVYVGVLMVAVLYGGSLAFSQLTGWNHYAVLWVTVVLTAAYAVKGGLRSVMFTDAVQCLLLVVGGVVLFFVALAKIPGGWSAMQQASPERFHLYRPVGDPIAPFLSMILLSVGASLFYQSSNQVMIQRVLAARSTWDGIGGIVFAGLINLLRPLVTCFLGFIVYHWIVVMRADPRVTELKNLDHAFPYALTHLAPSWGLRGLVLTGFIAAVMSTMSALANSTATIFSLNVYKRLASEEPSEQRLIAIGRIASAASLALAAVITMTPLIGDSGGIFKYVQTTAAYLFTPFISVMLLAILSKRVNYQGALFGLLGGTVIALAVGFGGPHLGLRLHWLYLSAISQAIIMAGSVIVSLLTPAPKQEQWKPFVWSRVLLSSYGEGDVRRPWWQSLILWYGIYVAIWALLYWWFW